MLTNSILLIAYNLHPKFGSEEGVAWDFLSLASESAEHVVVYTQQKYEDLFTEADKGLIPSNVSITYYDPVAKILNGDKPYILHYFLWHLSIFKKLKSSVEKYDLCHVTTWCNGIIPIFSLLLPIPKIWGPVAGFEAAPLSFYDHLPIKTRLKELVRFLLLKSAPFNPIIRYLYSAVGGIIVPTQESRSAILEAGLIEESKIFTLPVNCISENLTSVEKSIQRKEGQKALKLITSGRVLHWKGLDIVCEALVNVSSDVVLEVYGEGNYKEQLLKFCSDNGLADKVLFQPRVAQDELFKEIQGADIFILPSLHDSGPGAVVEAAYLGVPVVTTLFGGPKSNLKDVDGVYYLESRERLAMVSELTDLIESLDLSKKKGLVLPTASINEKSLLLKQNRLKVMKEIYKTVLS